MFCKALGGTECGCSHQSKERSWSGVPCEPTPKVRGLARRDTFPPQHQRATSRAAAPLDYGSGAPSSRSLSPPRGDAGWRRRWRWVCVSGGGGAESGRSSRGSRRLERRKWGPSPPSGVTDARVACWRRRRRRRLTSSGCWCSSRMRAGSSWAPRSTCPWTSPRTSCSSCATRCWPR